MLFYTGLLVIVPIPGGAFVAAARSFGAGPADDTWRLAIHVMALRNVIPRLRLVDRVLLLVQVARRGRCGSTIVPAGSGAALVDRAARTLAG